jgi:hypothetical protein
VLKKQLRELNSYATIKYMHCPNCRHILTKIDLDGIEVEHCNSCGSTLFEANEINRITLKDAERLQLIRQTDVISGGEKLSPRDGSILKRITNGAIPQHVTILESETTGEVFAFPDDLVEFKKAQNAKVEYYKAWHIPMPPVANVLVFGFAVFAAASLAYMVTLVQQPTSQPIQAQTLCENGIGMIALENQSGYVVSCTTARDLSCKVTAVCNDGSPVTLTCTDKTYFGTTSSTCSQVKFMYKDGNDVMETQWELLK